MLSADELPDGPVQHPTDAELQQFLAADPAAAMEGWTASHVDECAVCQQRIQDIDSSSSVDYLAFGSPADPDLKQATMLVDRIHREVLAEQSPLADVEVSTHDTLTFIRHLASGGISDLLLYRDHSLDRTVVVKTLRHDQAVTPVRARRFRREYEVMTRLRFPGVPDVYAHGRFADGREFFTMRFIAGDHFGKCIRQWRSGSPQMWRTDKEFRQLLNHLISACRTVSSAQRRNVIHRDLKPANLLVDQDHHLFVIDWGLAGLHEDDLASDDTAVDDQNGMTDPVLTSGGSRFGSPAYQSPEQAFGDMRQVDHRTDVFGLGAVFHEILTGEPPLRISVDELAGSAASGDAEQVLLPLYRSVADGSISASTVPAELRSICMKALDVDPAQRYRDADEFADDVQNWISGSVVTAHKYGWAGHVSRMIGRHPRMSLGAAMLMTAMLVVAAVLLQRSETLRTAADRSRREAVTASTNGMLLLDRVLAIAGDPTRDDSAEVSRLRRQIVVLLDRSLDDWSASSTNSQTDFQLGILLHRLGQLFSLDGRRQEAAEALQESCEILSRRPPEEVEAQVDSMIRRVDVLSDLATAYSALNDQVSALGAVRQAIQLVDRVSASALAQRNRLALPMTVGRKHAEVAFRQWESEITTAHRIALSTLQRCDAQLAQHPGNPDLLFEKARLLNLCGYCMYKSARYLPQIAKAYPQVDAQLNGVTDIMASYFQQSIDLLHELEPRRSDPTTLQEVLVEVYCNQGLFHRGRYQSDPEQYGPKLKGSFESGIALARELLREAPLNGNRRYALARVLGNYADAVTNQDPVTERVAREEATVLLRGLLDDSARDDKVGEFHALVGIRLARRCFLDGAEGRAAEVLADLHAFHGTLATNAPDAECLGYAVLHSSLLEQDRSAEAAALAVEAAARLRVLVAESGFSMQPVLRQLQDNPRWVALVRAAQVEQLVADVLAAGE
jgi:tRNA A-37 threonylcarbamoyl transferase component Bud32/tetratricopeptide (TPR) repeat protein